MSRRPSRQELEERLGPIPKPKKRKLLNPDPGPDRPAALAEEAADAGPASWTEPGSASRQAAKAESEPGAGAKDGSAVSRRPASKSGSIAQPDPAAGAPDSAESTGEGKEPRRTAVLSLGSNVGDRERNLLSAVESLAALKGSKVGKVSSIIETDPVGGPEQPRYLNLVVIFRTRLTPAELLEQLQRIENEHGRLRLVRWGARTLDIDVISFEDVIQSTPELTIPHPRAAERAFVLAPWLELDPDAVLPGAGPIEKLLPACPDRKGIHEYQAGLPGWKALVS